MNARLFILVLAGCGLALTSDAQGISQNARRHSYSAIAERNAFALKDPPPAVAPEPPVVTPPQDIFLTGMAKIGGKKRAYLSVPGQTPKTFQCVALQEGEQQGQILVLAGGINLREGTVKILNAGVPQILDFEKNGVKAAPAPAKPTVARPQIITRPIPIRPRR